MMWISAIFPQLGKLAFGTLTTMILVTVLLRERGYTLIKVLVDFDPEIGALIL